MTMALVHRASLFVLSLCYNDPLAWDMVKVVVLVIRLHCPWINAMSLHFVIQLSPELQVVGGINFQLAIFLGPLRWVLCVLDARTLSLWSLGKQLRLTLHD